MYFQNGDVLIKKVDSIPEDAAPIAGSLVHKGENHSHIIQGTAELYGLGDELYIHALSACQIIHDEHKPVEIPVGLYKKEIVKEYDHWTEEARNIID